jgi:hypothetical protein
MQDQEAMRAFGVSLPVLKVIVHSEGAPLVVAVWVVNLGGFGLESFATLVGYEEATKAGRLQRVCP